MHPSKYLPWKFHKHFEIIASFSKNPSELFIYGGALRDVILFGECSSDYDFLGTFDLEDVYHRYKPQILGYWPEVQTIKLFLENSTYDITNTNNPVSTLKSNDITVSNLAMGKNGQILDVVGGFESLSRKEIKINDPLLKILNDPSRILRVFRLSIQLGFHIEDTTYNACVKCLGNLVLKECPFEMAQLVELTNYQKSQLKQKLTQLGADYAKQYGKSFGTTVVGDISQRILSGDLS